MASKDIYKIENVREIDQGITKKKYVVITRKDKKMIKVDEFKNLYKDITKGLDKIKKPYKISVKAENIEKFIDFKREADSDLKLKDFDDYMKNKVKIKEKFSEFYRIEIGTSTYK